MFYCSKIASTNQVENKTLHGQFTAAARQRQIASNASTEEGWLLRTLQPSIHTP